MFDQGSFEGLRDLSSFKWDAVASKYQNCLLYLIQRQFALALFWQKAEKAALCPQIVRKTGLLKQNVVISSYVDWHCPLLIQGMGSGATWIPSPRGSLLYIYASTKSSMHCIRNRPLGSLLSPRTSWRSGSPMLHVDCFRVQHKYMFWEGEEVLIIYYFVLW